MNNKTLQKRLQIRQTANIKKSNLFFWRERSLQPAHLIYVSKKHPSQNDKKQHIELGPI